MTFVRSAGVGLLVVGIGCVGCPVPAAPAGAPREIVLTDCLVLPAVGRYGRSPVHLDPVEALLVSGRWKAPRAGETVTPPAGSPRGWRPASAKGGALDHAALRGGYAFWSVKSDARRVMLLEASGHLIAHVNGEPRAGDPYQNGIVRLPVLLRAGDNELLFHCGRGSLRAKLVEPDGPALLDARDATLPDYREGDTDSPFAALVVVNASEKVLAGFALRARLPGADPVTTPLGPLPPLSTRKAGFRLPPGGKAAGDTAPVEVELVAADGKPLAAAKLAARVRRTGQSYKRTFVSGIDSSVQYFAVQPAAPAAADGRPPALVLTLHGASVEATGQADAYAPKPWCHIVAPTNRRPFGFDWEDWGRLDALEVLDLAREQLRTDPRRTYLTGHSMGGYGTWHLGVTFPDRFAAIAPSAGWVSFATYGGEKPPDRPTPAEDMLRRASSAGDTLALVRNCARGGVYVLHGEADDNVPVAQGRAMRKELGAFHPDFAYYERPGAGHWWGSECVDWPPLFEFLRRHTLPRPEEVRRVDFVTASPGVSARCDWAEVGARAHAFRPSAVRLTLDPRRGAFAGTTENVTRLALDPSALPAGKSVHVELDGQAVGELPRPAGGGRLWLVRDGAGKWSAAAEPAAALKGPHRCGPFKEVFRNRVLFVYGTKGSAAENAWSYAKARFDAETFWYRGNGSVELRADADFDRAAERDRNVVLYGPAEGNAAWEPLLGGAPVRVRRGAVRVGDRAVKGDDLACLFVRPRPGSDRALVGAVTGTGPAGLRLTERLPYFVSGVGYPDCTVLGADTLTRGAAGVRVAGFFGNDWGVGSGEWVWQAAE